MKFYAGVRKNGRTFCTVEDGPSTLPLARREDHFVFTHADFDWGVHNDGALQLTLALLLDLTSDIVLVRRVFTAFFWAVTFHIRGPAWRIAAVEMRTVLEEIAEATRVH